jgi:hypothetical protein
MRCLPTPNGLSSPAGITGPDHLNTKIAARPYSFRANWAQARRHCYRWFAKCPDWDLRRNCSTEGRPRWARRAKTCGGYGATAEQDCRGRGRCDYRRQSAKTKLDDAVSAVNNAQGRNRFIECKQTAIAAYEAFATAYGVAAQFYIAARRTDFSALAAAVQYLIN